jgi:DNA-binding NtrC family response regulator
MEFQDETLDPQSGGPKATSFLATRPRADLLFHPDLARVGEHLALGAEARLLGREGPALSSGQPLLDPCVSRRQVSLAWSAARRRFVVRPDPAARRTLYFFSASGEPLPATEEVPPGTMVAIGDRVLLRLDLAAVEEDDDLGILGRDPSIVALRLAIRALADGPATVLIRGETGVGKELVAQALHRASSRAKAPFVAVNCAALPEHLVESELFGHARGAFSGAASARDGLFRAAGAGTLFLDEIGELPLPTQAKLLRALQERSVRPLGESREVPYDAKVVCATHRDLSRAVDEGAFRADLYARIESPEVVVPPLRERVSDVPLLFAHFVSSIDARWIRRASVEPPPVPLDLVLSLMRHGWPRNVRELQRWVVALVAGSQEGLRVPPFSRGATPSEPAPSLEPAPGAERARGRPELAELLRVLDAHDHVQHQVARALGCSRTTLDKWMRELGVRRPKDVPEDEVRAAYRAANGDVDAAARALRVSSRGLQLRVTELGVGKTGA